MSFSMQDHWYSRNYLPHRDAPGLAQFITFRLADSLPETTLRRIETELEMMPPSERKDARYRRLAALDDAGCGACVLRQARLALLVENSLKFFHLQRYLLLCWVIMPNHVHVAIRTHPAWHLDDILHSWKSYTAHEANKILGTQGEFWHREFHDRWIRDGSHLQDVIRYTHNNPVKARLCQEPENWPWTSAGRWQIDDRLLRENS